jgi:mannose-6-phosphate isomerase-like protein (cupin superfamily)
MGTRAELSSYVQEYLADPKSTRCAEQVIGSGLHSLSILREFLRQDLPIEQTERLEAVVKAILRAAMSRPVSGTDARQIALFQKELGFVLKYKSYAIKAATPVGYSIFLQNEREGFSFQRHVVHKLEVFHILSVKPGGYVFLCDYDDWKRVYERDSFTRWLQGEPNQAYDRYRFVPEPGDVFTISELGIVHTVVGCVLEEYATVSTDMVERLHDQNLGKKIPSNFNRAAAEPVLRALAPPAQNRFVRGFGERNIERIEPVSVQGGERTVLCDSFVRAARYLIGRGKETALDHDDHRTALLRFFSGHGTVVIADASECGVAPPRVPFSQGDLFLVAPGIRYAVRNEGDGDVAYSEHCIAPDVAFV